MFYNFTITNFSHKESTMKKLISSFSIVALLLGSGLVANQTTQAKPVNPFEEIQKVQQQMDQIFNNLHQKLLNDASFSNFDGAFIKSPATDIVDKKDHYLIQADIPGVDNKNINVSEKDGVLKIEAKTNKQEKEKKDNFVKQERFTSQFVKIVTLPKDADASKMKTEYKNGVLKITIPKKK